MTNSAGEDLLGHLLDALDGKEHDEVEARLDMDPGLRRQRRELREQLDLLSPGRVSFAPPPGLAERTCRLVASHDRRDGQLTADLDFVGEQLDQHDEARAAKPARRRCMSPGAAPPSWISQFSRTDLIAAASVVIVASLLLFPALQQSRFQSRLISCQDNLRGLGGAMKQYSQLNNGFFPQIPAQGKVSAAGIYAPLLRSYGLLENTKHVVCPGSELADKEQFHIPSPEELDAASDGQLEKFRSTMGGSYGYNLGYIRNGRYYPTKDRNRTYFGLMADAPGSLPGSPSINHGGRGQNVLFEDGRVIFIKSSKPHVGADDIYSNDNSVIGPSSARPIFIMIRERN